MFNMLKGGKGQSGKEPNAKSAHKDNSLKGQDKGEMQGVAAETVAKILRTLGRHSFDLDKGDAEIFEKEFEQWARHVLLGTSTTEEPNAKEGLREGQRDWGGVFQFVNRHRQNEKHYVVQGFHDLRDVVWAFISTVSQAFVTDKETDGHMLSHIGRLKSAVANKSPEQMKRDILAAAEDLSRLVEDRSLQQQIRMEKLGTKLKEVEAELGNARKQMALDPLTQLYNRAALDQHIERVGALSVLSGSPSCLMMVDIDEFKNLNDTYGHRAGDSVIRELAKRTVLGFPRRTDFVARYGGEEFVVVLQGESLEGARIMAHRLLSDVRQDLFQHEELQMVVSVSIGLAEFIPGDSPETWIDRADQALYRAKENGRNQLCVAGELQAELVDV